MRYILGLFTVLAVGSSAWTSAMGNVTDEPGYQTPAATVTSAVTQATGTPASPAPSPVSAYQAATAQPAGTTMSPAPTMMSPGTYTPATQPGATYYATPMGNTVYTTNSYPMRARRGLFGMRSTPMYYSPSTPVTTTYVSPVQTYAVAPSQTYYQPVRPRFGLFQRWRQQRMPAYNTTPAYGTPMYSTSGYAAPVTTTYRYGTPVYDTTTYPSSAATVRAGTMTPPGTIAGSAAPVYTPTTLDVPNGTSATTAPAEPPLQGTTPASTVPTPPGVGGATTSPVPAIPQGRPR